MTRVLIDTCVLYPSILRSVLMGCAKAGLFEPLWSARILEEWRRAAARNGVAAEAGIEIAMLTADWRDANVTVADGAEDDIVLPDQNDRHVLAAAIEGNANELLTANTGDFPTRVLAQYGVIRRHPDEFLLELALAQPEVVSEVIDRVHAMAEAGKGERVNRRKMLQKSGVPRMAKWDAGVAC
ncbi:PIN domain-containing protein [Amylibacter sp. IMCC11727]|uniref:RSP_2648 family PIN domain-containing protein n=1 Tax=Amylibacter sp. IMCC11727 TaxID=3039851 RepID=UPI00244E4CC2|nr:PIN domain-containing protein [Amylibacter sp. IMCC11727]WGI21031.1 PIN domain-containing protein [Amylibacter sp. IMCC11727]